jgi:hypothetical protein
MINVEPTAQIIDSTANELRLSADKLNKISSLMRERNDLSYASEALSEILNTLQNARLDLLITRPIRALSK